MPSSVQQIQAISERIGELERTLNVVVYNTTLAKNELDNLKKDLIRITATHPEQQGPIAASATPVQPAQKAETPTASQTPRVIIQKPNIPEPPLMHTTNNAQAKRISPEKTPVKKKRETFFAKEVFVGRNIIGIIASVLIFLSIAAFAAAVFPYLGKEARFAIMIVASLVFFGAGLIRQEKHASAFNVVLAACGMGSLFISLLCGRLFFGLLTDAILFALLLSWGIVCSLIYKRHPYRVFCIIGHLGIVISVSVAAAKIITLLLDAGEVTVETHGTAYWTLLFTAVYVLILEVMYGSMFRGSVDRIIEAVSTGCSAFIMLSITAFLAKKGYNWETKPYLSDIGTGMSSAAVFSLHGILSVAVMALVIILGWTVLTKDFLHKESGPVAYRIIGLELSVSVSPMFFTSGEGTAHHLITLLPALLSAATYVIAKKGRGTEEDRNDTVAVLDKVLLGFTLLWLIAGKSPVWDYTGPYIPALLLLVMFIRERTKYSGDYLFITACSALYLYVVFPCLGKGHHYETAILVFCGAFTALSLYIVCLGQKFNMAEKIFTHIHSVLFWFRCAENMTDNINNVLTPTPAGQYISTSSLTTALFIFGVMMVGFIVRKAFTGTKGERFYFAGWTITGSIISFMALCFMDTDAKGPVQAIINLCAYIIAFISVFCFILQVRTIETIFGKTVWGMYDSVAFTFLFCELAHRSKLSYAMSIALLLCAIACIVMGFRMKIKQMRIYAMALIFLSTFKLIFVDMYHNNTIGKAASLFLCGILLFGVSFLYGRMEKKYGEN